MRYDTVPLIVLCLIALSGCAQAGQTTPAPAPPTVRATESPTAAAQAATEPARPATTETGAAQMTATPAAIPTQPATGPTPTASEPASSPTPAPPADTPAAEVTGVGLELIAEGLASPVYLAEAPDESGRLFVVDQIGVVRIIGDDGELLETPFLDVRDRMVDLGERYDERGLLGLAFHPEFASNGRFFLYYSAPLREGAPAGWNHTSHVSEFRVSPDDPNRADPGSERIVMQIDQPQPNHNAGTLAFGPDGYLYISLGDGGGANDTGAGHTEDWFDGNAGGNAQNTENLLGSILRIDVDAGEPYGLPPDNPFVNRDGADEIFAYGFRNPYRFSFDLGGSRELFAADAGQSLWEEVSIVTKGGNYGWNVREGAHCFDAENPSVSPAECPDSDPSGAPLLDPVIEYQNANAPGGLGLVVVGGFVYRGTAIPQLDGRYVFGDWSTSFGAPDGSLFVAMRPESGEGMWAMRELQISGRPGGALGHYLLGFGQDLSGEVYALTTDNAGPAGNTGKVYRLVP